MDKNSTIKDNIYKIRRSKGLSQEFLADSLNISINSYRKLEKGDTIIINKRLEQIAKLLDVNLDELLLSDSEAYLKYELNKISHKNKDIRIKDLEGQVKNMQQCIDLLNEKLESYTKTK